MRLNARRKRETVCRTMNKMCTRLRSSPVLASIVACSSKLNAQVRYCPPLIHNKKYEYNVCGMCSVSVSCVVTSTSTTYVCFWKLSKRERDEQHKLLNSILVARASVRHRSLAMSTHIEYLGSIASKHVFSQSTGFQ
jgi:hypothetical protein